MKILVKDKIVESFRFPFSEALSFSILVWTLWGLAEAFYWHRLAPLFNDSIVRINSSVYIEAFLLYICLAAILALFIFAVVKLSLVALECYEANRFRSLTLSMILLSFFFLALNYYIPNHLLTGALPKNLQYGLAAGLITFGLGITILLFRWASAATFRIRRSGTMMLSILAVSLILSFVRFPIFSPAENTRLFSFHPALTSVRSLTIYYYLRPLIVRKNQVSAGPVQEEQ